MSYEDRSIDKTAIIVLQDGQEYYFNMFQDGGAMVKKVTDKDGWYELYCIPLYGGLAYFDKLFDHEQIDVILEEVYETWI
jgi:hypothetical protein